jgi:hypothetical protein
VRTAVLCPCLHFRPISFGFCYYLLWWLSQYNTLVD